MKRIKLLVSIAIFAGLFATSCTEEDPVTAFQRPAVISSTNVLNVPYGASNKAVDFSVSVDPNLTATFSATGTGVTIQNSSGSVNSPNVSINFDAGANSGAASVTLTVTDSEGQSANATAVINIDKPEYEIKVNSNINENTTWSAGKVYILGGRITVVNGVTLTIEPGTIIKGEAGTGANATALLIARGGTLLAEGTAEKPIIFTSVADEISPEDIVAGNFESPNLDPDINGLWGGLIVLGRAPVSASNESGDVSEVQIEGIPTSDQNGLYGGNVPEDNSGVLKYISIRHGGTNIGSGNEINGLSLGGVGSGTVVENIEIVANQDDGIEWFGGTVNVKNVVVWNVGDDGIDTDQSWNGTLDNFIVIAPAGHCFELDGPEGSMEAGHIIKNGTISATVGDRKSEDLINVDNNSIVDLKNLFFTNISGGQKINRVTAPKVTFEGIEIDVTSEKLADHVNGDIPAGIIAGKGTNKANPSVFEWTWAKKAGALAGL